MAAEQTSHNSGLSNELLEVASYVISTCSILECDERTGIRVGWSGQTNPMLAVKAELAYPIQLDPLNPRIIAVTMMAEDPDIGFSLTLERKRLIEELNDNDPIGLYILEMFRNHYQKKAA